MYSPSRKIAIKMAASVAGFNIALDGLELKVSGEPARLLFPREPRLFSTPNQIKFCDWGNALTANGQSPRLFQKIRKDEACMARP
jgi:hypothetical protein